MSKFSFSRISSLINAPSAINGILTQIEAALDSLLSRDGTSPNQMGANLDMNSNRVINLPYPTSNTEPVRKQDFSSLLAISYPASVGIVNVWQLKMALQAMGDLYTVDIAVPADITTDVNILWNNGTVTSVGDALSTFIKTTLNYTDGEMTALYTLALTYIL